ncbi:hypothetical protein BKA63DRAFT_494016 [Paraphoma chrysanthemicola]|nr:hypothetical protein BKA63DRAFT_494016 [Paraphoma chrysanthemicola]
MTTTTSNHVQLLVQYPIIDQPTGRPPRRLHSMSFFTTLCHRVRKMLFIAIILTILVHEPAFQVTINILINVHVAASMGFDEIHRAVVTHFPIAATWLLGV